MTILELANQIQNNLDSQTAQLEAESEAVASEKSKVTVEKRKLTIRENEVSEREKVIAEREARAHKIETKLKNEKDVIELRASAARDLKKAEEYNKDSVSKLAEARQKEERVMAREQAVSVREETYKEVLKKEFTERMFSKLT